MENFSLANYGVRNRASSSKGDDDAGALTLSLPQSQRQSQPPPQQQGGQRTKYDFHEARLHAVMGSVASMCRFATMFPPTTYLSFPTACSPSYMPHPLHPSIFQAMSDFERMFPSLGVQLIQEVLYANYGDVHSTIDQLVGMDGGDIDLSPPASNGANRTQRPQQRQPVHDGDLRYSSPTRVGATRLSNSIHALSSPPPPPLSALPVADFAYPDNPSTQQAASADSVYPDNPPTQRAASADSTYPDNPPMRRAVVGESQQQRKNGCSRSSRPAGEVNMGRASWRTWV